MYVPAYFTKSAAPGCCPDATPARRHRLGRDYCCFGPPLSPGWGPVGPGRCPRGTSRQPSIRSPMRGMLAMWPLLTLSRKRVEVRRTPARRPRRYRPRCRPLEQRRLLSIQLTDVAPPVPYVGAPVVWTATATGHGTTPVYQFRVGPAGGASQVVRDFSTSNTFTWDPLQEGSYDVQVTVKDSFAAS